MNLKLRYILTIAFTIVAVVPIVFIGFWVERTALRKEIDAVWEKHLLIADHTAALLEHYAHNVESAFNYLATLTDDAASAGSAVLIAKRFGLRHFCVVDDQFRVLRDIRSDPETAGAFDAAIMTDLMPLVHNHIAYSAIRPDSRGEPTIFLVKRLAEDRLAMAALEPDQLIRLQTTVSFGHRGHAAIVDQEGNVIAHPNDAWRKTMKNISAIEPVRRMMAKERGVVTFYSPAMQMEMISGYTTVAQTGWGIMVPQPMEELIAKAEDVKRIAVILAACGILAASFVSWIIAGRLVRPLEALQTAAQRIANGKLQSRVPPLSRFTSSDMRELAADFNNMAERIRNDQKTLATALSRAQSADHAKSKFLANMSHELRTPLNAIIGFSQTMEGQVFGEIGNPRYVDYARDIRKSGEHLLSIINYILDLSKIEGGEAKIEDDEVVVPTMIASALSMLENTASEARIELATDIEPSLPHVRGSDVNLKQVLVNLVSNAIKYTPEGGRVEIMAWMEHSEGIAISVRDNGIGMSKSEVTTALVPFGRVENEMAQRVSGAGLGLPLAKRLIELHGGRMHIDSEKGRGTTVTIYLPTSRIIAEVA